jgi:hypothetical protein
MSIDAMTTHYLSPAQLNKTRDSLLTMHELLPPPLLLLLLSLCCR